MIEAAAIGGHGAPGQFARWQPVYAERGIPTFPVRIVEGVKRPAVRGYLRTGLDRSRELARQFSSNDAFGFALGKPSGLTVLDIDSPDERVLADALDRHGKTPFIVRSGGHGHFQAWFKHNGERRSIRPDKTQPIDVLGGGYVVAPPSRGTNSNYEILQGSLDDLAGLPKLKGIAQPCAAPQPFNEGAAWAEMGQGSGRNNALFRQLGREARTCDDFEQLLDRAQTLNADFAIPMDAPRVVAVARSVWTMTTQGRNRFGQHGAFIPLDEADRFANDPYLLALIAWLRAHNGPESIFMVADGLQDVLQWPRRQLADARKRAIQANLIVLVSRPAPGRAARYAWAQADRAETTALVEDHLPNPVGLDFQSPEGISDGR